ncbi:hypothetical protein [Streptodolium elevatio]
MDKAFRTKVMPKLLGPPVDGYHAVTCHPNGLGGEQRGRAAPSIPHLIESHAVADAIAPWQPWSNDTHVASAVAELPDDLLEVPDVSWRSSRWRLSETVAVKDFDNGDRENPGRHTLLWSCDEAGHREVQEVLNRVMHGSAMQRSSSS